MRSAPTSYRRSLPLGGLLLFLGACVHGQVAPSPRLSCDGTWEQCLLNDLDALAEASRKGQIKPWVAQLAQAIRRSRADEVPLLLRYFFPPAHHMDRADAQVIMSALASHDADTLRALPLRSARHALERVWSSAATMRPATGRLARWWMVSGFESSRGAALTRVDPPQTRLVLTEPVRTPLGERPWRSIESARNKSLIYPQDWTSPTRQRCHHLATAFRADVAVALSLRGGNERRVWINNQPVIEFSGLESSLRQFVTLGAPLPPGRHQIEIRSCPKAGSGAFELRAHSPGGELVAIEPLVPSDRLTPLLSTFPRFDAESEVRTRTRSVSDQRLRAILGIARLADLGRSSDAIALFESIPNPGRIEQLMAIQLAINNRRKELALTTAGQLGDDLSGLVWRANALLSLQQSDRAARLVLPKLDALMKHSRRAQVLLGKVIGNQAPSSAAYRYWRDVVENDPSWPYALQQLRSQLERLGEKTQANEIFERLRAFQPAAAGLLNQARERAERTERWAEALRLTRALIERDDRDIGHRLTYASLLVRDNQYEAARREVEAILAQNPYSVGALRWMIRQVSARQSPQAAAPYRERLAAVQPDHSQVLKAERYQALRSPQDEIRIPNWSRPSAQALQQLVEQRAQHRPKQAVSQVLLLDDHLDLIQADGSRRQVVTLVRWFLDRGAAQRYLKINLSGLRNRQIHHAYLVQPNGARVDPVSLRGGKIRFREIGPGSVLVLQYESTSKPSRLINGLVEGTFWFEGADAYAVQSRFTLASARPDLNPRFTVVGREPERDYADQNGVKVWSFERRQVGPAIMELNVQAPWRYRSQVRFSTMGSWDPYVGWVRDLFRQSGKITPKLSQKAKELVGARTETEAMIDAIYRFAVEDIQYEQDYARVIEGWEPHLPDQVLDRSYGDCKDKSMLIITMLRSLGIKAEPALIRTWRLGDIDRSLPGSQFNHAVVYLPEQAGLPAARFLDATAEYLDRDNLRIDVQGTDALVIEDDSWRWVTVPERPSYEEMTQVELEYEGDHIWNATMRYRGHTAGMIRRVGKGDKQRFLLQNIATGALWPGSQVLEGRVDEVDQRLRLSLKIKTPEQAVRPDGSIDLPLIVKRVWMQRFAQSERQLPLRLSSSRDLRVVIRSRASSFQADKGMETRSEHHAGRWSCEERQCVFEMSIKPLIIAPEIYDTLGKALRSFHNELADRKIRPKQRI